MNKPLECLEPRKDRIRWMLRGVAVGDALGVPTEMHTANAIARDFWFVRDFLPTRNNRMFVKDGFPTDSEETGYYSDDTVLTYAIIRSIARTGRLDVQDVALEQSQAILDWPYGFGRGTKEAFERIRNGTDISCSGSDTAGNGVLMKQSPIAAYQVLSHANSAELRKDFLPFVRMTHDSSEAVVASIVHHRLLVQLLLSPETSTKFSAYYMLCSLLVHAQQLEREFGIVSARDSISGRVQRILDHADSRLGVVWYPIETIREDCDWWPSMGSSCRAFTTLAIAYSLFFRNPNFDSVLDAVNFWGDTDSYAWIVGSMVGAIHGSHAFANYFSGVQHAGILASDIEAFLSHPEWDAMAAKG